MRGVSGSTRCLGASDRELTGLHVIRLRINLGVSVLAWGIGCRIGQAGQFVCRFYGASAGLLCVRGRNVWCGVMGERYNGRK